MAELSIHRVQKVTVTKEFFPTDIPSRDSFWVVKIHIHGDYGHDEVTLYVTQEEEPEINME